ncbi:hypothetical protein ACFSKW_52085 [Nonomuraea mangrovi]|uniref:Uncharacterized protein n=1 Tax=Nonomuraea mangrovi TaxID=2316207 RepID=A0ABW4TDC1_9ACTN
MSDQFVPIAGEQAALHHVVTRPEPGRLAIVLTGAVGISNAHAEGQAWTRFRVNWTRNLPLGPGKRLRPVYWAPFVTLSSFANDNVASNAGWAVDEFGLSNANGPTTFVDVWANLAVRDADGWILRLAYTVHIVGDEI